MTGLLQEYLVISVELTVTVGPYRACVSSVAECLLQILVGIVTRFAPECYGCKSLIHLGL